MTRHTEATRRKATTKDKYSSTMSEVDWRILHHALDTGRSQRPMTSSELAASRESARSAGSSLPRLTLSDQLRIIGTSAELRSMQEQLLFTCDVNVPRTLLRHLMHLLVIEIPCRRLRSPERVRSLRRVSPLCIRRPSLCVVCVSREDIPTVRVRLAEAIFVAFRYLGRLHHRE